MIVKTGANYQSEGGYIEFSADNPNGVTIINGNAVPTNLYENITGIIGYMPVKVRKTQESEDAIRVITYDVHTSLEGVKFMDYNFYTATTTATSVKIPTGSGVPITVPSGKKPILADGSKDVRIIRSSTTYYLIITGENPEAVFSCTEA